ncbi:MAG: hypothetical protein QM820_57900 [Minicystis sp.]
MRSLVTCGVATFLLSITAAASAATGPVSAARHHGVVSGEMIRWTSEYLLTPDAPPAVDLAYPLPGGSSLEAPQAVSAVEHAGRVTTLRLPSAGMNGGRVVVTITEPLARHGREVRLSPPLAAGDAVQIVDVEGGDDLRFEPDSAHRAGAPRRFLRAGGPAVQRARCDGSRDWICAGTARRQPGLCAGERADRGR